MALIDQQFGGVLEALKMKMDAEAPEVGQVDTESNVIRPEDLRKALDSADIAATAVAKAEAAEAAAFAGVPEAAIRESRENKRGEQEFAGVKRTFSSGDVARGYSQLFRGVGRADTASEV